MQCLNISLKKVFLLSPFYRWKLRLREMKYLTHGHSTSKWPAKLGLKLRSSDSMTHNPNDLPGGIFGDKRGCDWAGSGWVGWEPAPTHTKIGTHPRSQASSSPARPQSGPAPWPAPQGSSSGSSHRHVLGSWPGGRIGRSRGAELVSIELG